MARESTTTAARQQPHGRTDPAGAEGAASGSVEPSCIDRSTRLLFFDAYPHVYAGAQRVTHQLARGFAGAGHPVSVATVGDGPFTDALRAERLRVAVVPAPDALRHYGRTTTGATAAAALAALPGYWLRLWRALRRFRPDLVHLDDLRGMLLAAVPARLAGARVVWHVHALEPHRHLNRLGAMLAHAVAVPAAAVVERQPELGQHRAPTVITNPAPLGPAPAPIPAGAPLVVTIARLHPDKGLDVLLRAVALLVGGGSPVQVAVLGGVQDGYEDLAGELHKLAAELGVGDRVTFAGHIGDPRAWLDRAMVYVQPSRERTEILPLAVLEAMAAARPVVATDVGALREQVTQGVTGALVPPEDPEALAEAVAGLLEDPDRARRLGEAGRVRVAQHFTPRRCVDEAAALYGRLLQPSPERRHRGRRRRGRGWGGRGRGGPGGGARRGACPR